MLTIPPFPALPPWVCVGRGVRCAPYCVLQALETRQTHARSWRCPRKSGADDHTEGDELGYDHAEANDEGLR